MNYFIYTSHHFTPHGKIWTQLIDLVPNVWLHSAVGRASHRYRGGHGFESRWSPDFFQASSFQLLKLENLLRWSFFTFTFSLCRKIKFTFPVIMACYSQANHVYAFPLSQSRPCGLIFSSLVHSKFSDLSECCEKFFVSTSLYSEFLFILVSSHEFMFEIYLHYFVSKDDAADLPWSKVSRSEHECGCRRRWTNRRFGSTAEKLLQTKEYRFHWQQDHSSFWFIPTNLRLRLTYIISRVFKDNATDSPRSKVSGSQHGCGCRRCRTNCRTNRPFGSTADKRIQTKEYRFHRQQDHSLTTVC